MPALQVKDCPNDVYESLRQCAAIENRSISQQALTIIELYLGFKVAPAESSSSKTNALEIQNGDFSIKRNRIFSSLENIPPVPHSKKAPSSSKLLKEIRNEEAR